MFNVSRFVIHESTCSISDVLLLLLNIFKQSNHTHLDLSPIFPPVCKYPYVYLGHETAMRIWTFLLSSPLYVSTLITRLLPKMMKQQQ